MLVGEDTIKEMARAFKENLQLEFSNRLLTALEAGQQAGGDKRGRQSAALLIVEEEDYPLLDLRVDEHEDPVKELRRMYEMAQEELVPRMKTLPTKENPGGNNDLTHDKEIGLVEEDDKKRQKERHFCANENRLLQNCLFILHIRMNTGSIR